MGLDEQRRTAERLQELLGGLYKLERELPAGGMSRLFLATDTNLGRTVVVKLLPPELSTEANATRFRREMEIASRLQHPHILPILAAGARGDLLYYVMPYVEGESLRHALNRERRMPVGDALRLLREIADALSLAHGRGIVHRDLKPENILLEGTHAVLTDFGVAKALNEASGREGLTGTGFAIGTPGYMAPEQIAAERSVDARADLYALGVIAYEMLAGEPPYTGASSQQIFAAHMSDPVPSVRTIRNDVPESLAAALRKAMAKDPDERQQSAAEFLRDIGHSPGKRPERRPPAFAIALGLTLLLGAVAVWLIVREGPVVALEADRIAIAPFDVVGEGLEIWHEGLVDMLSRNLDGAGPLTTVSPTAVIRHWSGRSDVESASLLAKETGARFVVFGSLIQSGPDSVRLRGTIRDVMSNRNVGDVEHAGLAERMDLMADSFTVAVLQRLNAPTREGGLRISSLGSSSMQAIRAFLRAEQQFRKSGWDSARAGYREAVQLDSTFALAWSRLALTTGWVQSGEDSVTQDAYLHAGRHNRGLPTRDSLMIVIDSLRAPMFSGMRDTLLVQHTERVFRLNQALLERYPDDPVAWYSWGETLFHFGVGRYHDRPLAEARAAFDQVIALDSTFAPAYIHPVELSLALSDTAGARRYIDKFLSFGGQSEHRAALTLARALIERAPLGDSAVRAVTDTTSLGAFWFGEPIMSRWPDLPVAWAEEGSRARRRLEQDARLAVAPSRALAMAGRLKDAAAAFPSARGRSDGWLQIADYLTGSLSDAERERISGDWWYLLQARRAEAGDTAWFARRLAELDRYPDTTAFDRYMQRIDRQILSSYLSLARGDTAEALRKFEALPDSSCADCSPGIIGIARVYIAQNRFDDALKLLPLRPARWPWPFDPVIRFERGRALEGLGRLDEARASYAWVAGKWRHADPELQPVVSEARASLARLTAEGAVGGRR